jgi:uridine kinase
MNHEDSTRRARTLFIGVGGGTGSGKTTIAQALLSGLPFSRRAHIQHDSYYRDHPELDDAARDCLNFDHPAALETELMVKHLDALRASQVVRVPRYDFASHRRGPDTVCIEPAPVVIVEGILVLAEPTVRDRLDVKLYVDTPADIRLIRRIRRDIAARGRTFEQVCAQYVETVRPMHLAFVEPSKDFADIIIPEGGENRVAVDMVLAKVLHWLQRLGV